MKILKSQSIYYDDVNLIAQPCVIKSRKDITKELYRIIVSPMTSVTGATLIEGAASLGLTVCVHRFQDVQDQLISSIKVRDYNNLFFAVGLNDNDRIKFLIKNSVKNFIIDIASGYMFKEIEEVVKFIKENGKLEKLIVGNVHTKKAFKKLSHLHKFLNLDNEVHIRVGIGNGTQCITSDTTGFNRGQITEITETAKLRMGILIADGGIRNSGDAVKAFAAGADRIMLGSFFAQAEEAECHVKGHKKLFGGASRRQAELLGKTQTHSEGRETEVQGEIKPLKVLIDELWGGISSGISYGGQKSLTNFIGKGYFEFKI